MFIITLTTALSSLGATATSAERRTACAHSFHIHRIFTHDRVVCGSIIQWVIGATFATIEVLTNSTTRMATATTAPAFQIPHSIVTLAAAIPVCVNQLRLLFFSKAMFIVSVSKSRTDTTLCAVLREIGMFMIT